MKTTPAVRHLVCLLATVCFVATASARVVGRVHAMFQATVKIEVTNGPIIYIDPTNISETNPNDADIILLTHNHGDHQQTVSIDR